MRHKKEVCLLGVAVEQYCPGLIIGNANFARVREYYQTHLGAKQSECAKALKLSPKAINRHVNKLRSEWAPKRKRR